MTQACRGNQTRQALLAIGGSQGFRWNERPFLQDHSDVGLTTDFRGQRSWQTRAVTLGETQWQLRPTGGLKGGETLRFWRCFKDKKRGNLLEKSDIGEKIIKPDVELLE